MTGGAQQASGPSPDARTTNGRRIYALGDIHGCLAELDAVYAGIHADLARDPHPDPVIVHVGDYIDRGPDSRGVIDRLIDWDMPAERICLAGNHDDLMLKFLDDPHGIWCRFHWLEDPLGGRATLASYGIESYAQPAEAAAAAAQSAVPQAHLAFLRGLPRSARIGSYFFAHAGVRPGKPLDAQDPEDLIWIRGEFLTSRAEHGAIIVHGHTPVEAPDLRWNRINIDTGCVFGRRLTCLVLEGDGIWTLDPGGRQARDLPSR
ncbi:MAG: metallophosphoesterase family protein [Pseudomonadota bacterium]